MSGFQEKVTRIFESINISEFDGNSLKLYEGEIRESALILAGECIALLLHNLSESQVFLDKAVQQTHSLVA